MAEKTGRQFGMRFFESAAATLLLSLAMPALLSPVVAAEAVAEPADDPAATIAGLDALMDVYLKVRATYVDKVDDRELIKGAINGMLSSLDPHSSYLDADSSRNMRTQTDGEYGGLGLTVTSEDGAVRVVAPTDDTPAARAGMRSGDFITHLDGKLIFGSTLNDAVEKMRGTPGTSIRLTVVRPGESKPLEFTLVRELIKVRPVKAEARGNVGLIRISSFNRQTGPAVRQALKDLPQQIGDIAGYVIDLRSNPGGLLDQAIDVSDAFLERGEIVSQRGRDKRDIDRYFARADDMANGLPIVVLVDEGSASAAEIVAGALQDQKRALIVGQRTFGKGTVQTLIPLTSDTGLRLTTARYYTPSGRSVQEAGIEPDLIIPQLTNPSRNERPRVREADLRNHLLAEVTDDDQLAEEDSKPDPRFDKSAEELEKAGISDFQLDYAIRLVSRLGGKPPAKKG